MVSDATGNHETWDYAPIVNAVQEFKEIANDFTNPLELVREAISNSYDAGATRITILFDTVEYEGETKLRIRIHDDGEGMTRDNLQKFFDLGNSSRTQSDEDHTRYIGEKGHGTKVFFKSERIHVSTSRAEATERLEANVQRPLAYLYQGKMPHVEMSTRGSEEPRHGTWIEIIGYNNNRREMFTHDQLRDYIVWFTRFGSLQEQMASGADETVLLLQGLDREDPEELRAGHPFPDESPDSTELFNEYEVRAPDYYAKRWYISDRLPSFPEIEYRAVFWVEGDGVKRGYNQMVRGRGRPGRPGMYQVQDRYGLWLCKDFIPIEPRHSWLTTKGKEYTKFHAFFNCQRFRLTANRGSVANTETEILAEVERVCRDLYTQILASDDWVALAWLEEEAAAYVSQENETKNLQQRIKYLENAPRAVWEGRELFLPRQEAGVYSLFLIMSTLQPTIFPFRVLDYDTYQGVDVIAAPINADSITETKLWFVEFKYSLSSNFNHSFENLHAVVCWGLDCKIGEEVADAVEETRVLEKVSGGENQPSAYHLTHPKKARRVQVIVLSEYLEQTLGLKFS